MDICLISYQSIAIKLVEVNENIWTSYPFLRITINSRVWNTLRKLPKFMGIWSDNSREEIEGPIWGLALDTRVWHYNKTVDEEVGA